MNNNNKFGLILVRKYGQGILIQNRDTKDLIVIKIISNVNRSGHKLAINAPQNYLVLRDELEEYLKNPLVR